MNIYFDKDYNLLITKEEQEDKTNFVYADNYIELVSLFGLTIINNKEKRNIKLKTKFLQMEFNYVKVGRYEFRRKRRIFKKYEKKIKRIFDLYTRLNEKIKVNEKIIFSFFKIID